MSANKPIQNSFVKNNSSRLILVNSEQKNTSGDVRRIFFGNFN